MMGSFSDDVLLKACRNNDISVVGFAITPWHALGIKSFVAKLKEEGRYTGGIACLQQHSKTGMCLDGSIFKNTGLSIESLYSVNSTVDQVKVAFRRARLMQRQKKAVFNSKPPLHVLCPSFPGSYIRSSIGASDLRPMVFVQIDEGLSAYMLDSRDWVEKSIADRNLHGYKAALRRLLGLCDDAFFSRCKSSFSNKGRYVRWMLLNEDMTPNWEVVQWYKTALLDELPVVDRAKVSHYEGAIVINTQPLVEDGVVEEEKYLATLQAVIDSARSRGREVVVKLHPRETEKRAYERLSDCWVDKTGKVSQESLISACREKPAAIVGFDSSTLLTSRLFFDVPTVSIASMLKNNSGIVDSEDVLSSRFASTFSGTVHFPSNDAELEDVFRQIMP